MAALLKTLFLHPPSFKGFDGGAGARYQARREIRSFWYPTWLAQTAALVPGSRLVDAPPAGLTLDDVAPLARDYELAVLHPYVSLYTGRGCRSRCTFCLWPQTVGGHRYRTRSVEHVVAEIAQATRHFPTVKEYFFDDDTFTDDLPRAEAIARGLGRLGVTWSCNAKANVPPETLEVLKDNGLRLLLVGYESGNQGVLNSVKKGVRLDVARRFTRDARALGIKIHGTFIMGLPGETRETIEETIRFARDIDPDSLQVSLAAPYPGTALYREALERGWLERTELVDAGGTQTSVLGYPHLSREEIFASVERFYRRFYFRPRKLFGFVKEMARDFDVCTRRLAEGREFLKFLARRHSSA